MKSSPIYSIINNPKRVSDCSFGSNGFSQAVQVGTSSSNSHTLADISVQMHNGPEGTVFNLFIDGLLVKQGILNDKKLSMTVNRLKRLK